MSSKGKLVKGQEKVVLSAPKIAEPDSPALARHTGTKHVCGETHGGDFRAVAICETVTYTGSAKRKFVVARDVACGFKT